MSDNKVAATHILLRASCSDKHAMLFCIDEGDEETMTHLAREWNNRDPRRGPYGSFVETYKVVTVEDLQLALAEVRQNIIEEMDMRTLSTPRC